MTDDTTTATVGDDAGQVITGSRNTQTSVEAGRDVLQEQYDQRQDTRILDQSRDDRRYNQSRDERRYDQRQDTVGGSNYNFQNPDNARVWEAIVELTKTMDNLPERMKTVEAIVLPVPAPLMAAVPVALALPGQPPITAVIPATGVAPVGKLPTWVIVTLGVMGMLMFILLLVGAVFLGAYLI